MVLEDPAKRSSTIPVNLDRHDCRLNDRKLLYLATKVEPIPSSIGRFSSATMAIVDIQLTRFGLPAICDVTCMQVDALVEIPAVMV